MPPRDSRVLVDTNAIQAAHKFGCWNGLCKYYRLETAELCIEEAVRPNRDGDRLVNRTAEDLRKDLTPHIVTGLQRAQLALALQGRVDLDDGERDLLSLANSFKGQAWWLCGPDKATLRAMSILRLLDQMCSLQLLARHSGVRVRSWEDQYTEDWLKKKRTLLLLGEELI